MREIPRNLRKQLEAEGEKLQRKFEDDQWLSLVNDWDSGKFSFAPPFVDAVGIGPSSKIMAPKGFRSIGSLKVNDEVVSHNLATEKSEIARVLSNKRIEPPSVFPDKIHYVRFVSPDLSVLPATEMFCYDYDKGWKWFRSLDLAQSSDPHSPWGVFTASTATQWRSNSHLYPPLRKTSPKEDDGFFALEVYPNNTFFANDPQGWLSSLGLYSAWGYLIKGYPGQIGRQLKY